MIYTEEMRASQARVEATRNIRLSEELPRFTAEEKGELLRQYHPDYHEEGFAVLSVGPNGGLIIQTRTERRHHAFLPWPSVQRSAIRYDFPAITAPASPAAGRP